MEDGEVFEEAEVADLDDLELLRLTRSDLEKWVNEPFFEKLAVGLLVRVNLGISSAADTTFQSRQRVIYRIARVISVNSGEIYEINNVRTDRYLMLDLGRKEKPFEIKYVSNKGFTQEELNFWNSILAEEGKSLISKEYVEQHKDYKSIADEFTYDEDAISEMVKRKEELAKRPKSIAVRKSDLLMAKEAAKDSNDMDAFQKITGQLAELDRIEYQLKSRALLKTSNSGVVDINEKNRRRNFEMSLAFAEKQRMERRRQSGDGEADPFSRRPTRPTFNFSAKNPEIEVTHQVSPAPSPSERPDVWKQTLDYSDQTESTHDFDFEIEPIVPAATGPAVTTTPASTVTTNGSSSSSETRMSLSQYLSAQR